MASGFAKVYGSILDSSVWMEDAPTRITWITLLVMADANGFVEASVSGIARRANVSLDQCRVALACFEGPDPDSKDPEHEGRRVERVPGGFVILNYQKYRERRSPTQIQTAERVRKWRSGRGVTCNAGNAPKRSVRAEADLEAETVSGTTVQVEPEQPRRSHSSPVSETDGPLLTHPDGPKFIEAWKTAYRDIFGADWFEPTKGYANLLDEALASVPVDRLSTVGRVFLRACKDTTDGTRPWDRAELWNFLRNGVVETERRARALGLLDADGKPAKTWRDRSRDLGHQPTCGSPNLCSSRVARDERTAEHQRAVADAGGPDAYAAKQKAIWDARRPGRANGISTAVSP